MKGRPGDPRAWSFLAETLPLDAAAEREAALRRAAELAPRNPLALSALANVLLEEGRSGEALPLARQAVQLGPFSPEVLDTYAAVAADLGNCEQAVLASRRALDVLPDDGEPEQRARLEKRLAAHLATVRRGGEVIRRPVRYNPATMQFARYSQMFIPTLKEAPADAQVASHRLLVRAGFIRQLGAGIYDHLPLARRSLAKVERIVREEMDAIGGQEFHLPAAPPRRALEGERPLGASWATNMFRLKDRKGADYCLGMTHEEIFAAIARDELRSYRQLPQVWYQIQTKFRDEPRPKSGLLRVREFTMKDAYSFDVDAAGLDRSYDDQRKAYEKIFTRCGLDFVAVQAHSGAMGGSDSQEFMVRTDAGEDDVAACPRCRYAANTETARSRGPVRPVDAGEPLDAPRKFPTPGVRTIEATGAAAARAPAARQLKTLVYAADEKLVLAVVRGDDELDEAKLQTATGAAQVRARPPRGDSPAARRRRRLAGRGGSPERPGPASTRRWPRPPAW